MASGMARAGFNLILVHGHFCNRRGIMSVRPRLRCRRERPHLEPTITFISLGTAVLAQANAGKPTITCIAAPCGRSIISLVRVDSRLRVGAAAHVIVLAGKTNAMARHKFLHGVVLPSLEDILLPNSFGR